MTADNSQRRRRSQDMFQLLVLHCTHEDEQGVSSRCQNRWTWPTWMTSESLVEYLACISVVAVLTNVCVVDPTLSRYVHDRVSLACGWYIIPTHQSTSYLRSMCRSYEGLKFYGWLSRRLKWMEFHPTLVFLSLQPVLILRWLEVVGWRFFSVCIHNPPHSNGPPKCGWMVACV
jgi:hypothetical protein